jgi:pyrimidine operon attenuation protein/uracil phosphoribosyltransferase
MSFYTFTAYTFTEYKKLQMEAVKQRLILNEGALNVTLSRLCMQLIENHGSFSETALIALQPRGKWLAQRIAEKLAKFTGNTIELGYLDATFFRDDFRRRDNPITANATEMPFLVEGKKVVLIDDVLYTGRSLRASLDAMQAFGRPTKVEYLVLVDRKYTREIPVEATYIGTSVNSIKTERVSVEWKEQGYESDNIWLLSK